MEVFLIVASDAKNVANLRVAIWNWHEANGMDSMQVLKECIIALKETSLSYETMCI